jgi:hypothetical protein
MSYQYNDQSELVQRPTLWILELLMALDIEKAFCRTLWESIETTVDNNEWYHYRLQQAWLHDEESDNSV